MAATVEINNNICTVATAKTAATGQFQRSLFMLRRSLSLSDYQEENLDILKLKNSEVNNGFLRQHYKKPRLGRPISMQDSGIDAGRRFQPHASIVTNGSATSSHELPSEVDIGPLASALFDSYFDTLVRCILLPVVIIFLIIYTFFHLPVQPKAEIYRSLSATFVLLVGIVVQCSVLTIWASRRYGLTEFIVFLQHCIRFSASPSLQS